MIRFSPFRSSKRPLPPRVSFLFNRRALFHSLRGARTISRSEPFVFSYCSRVKASVVFNLGYDRRLIYEQSRQDLGLCGYSYERYSEKCFTHFIEFCMKMPCWCPSNGHQRGGRKVIETSIIEFYYLNEVINHSIELRHIEIKTSSRARTV